MRDISVNWKLKVRDSDDDPPPNVAEGLNTNIDVLLDLESNPPDDFIDYTETGDHAILLDESVLFMCGFLFDAGKNETPSELTEPRDIDDMSHRLFVAYGVFNPNLE